MIPAGSSARPRRLTRLPISAIKKSSVCLPLLAPTRPLVSTACQTRTPAGGGKQTNRKNKNRKKGNVSPLRLLRRIKKRLADWSPPALPGARVVQSPRRPSPHYNTPFSRWRGEVGGLDTHHMEARRHALSPHLLLKRCSPPSFLILPRLALCIFFLMHKFTCDGEHFAPEMELAAAADFMEAGVTASSDTVLRKEKKTK